MQETGDYENLQALQTSADPSIINSAHENINNSISPDHHQPTLEHDEPGITTLGNFFNYIYDNFINIQLTERHTLRLCIWMFITNLFFLFVFLYNINGSVFMAYEMAEIKSLFIVFWFLDLLFTIIFYVNFYIFDKNQANGNRVDDNSAITRFYMNIINKCIYAICFLYKVGFYVVIITYLYYALKANYDQPVITSDWIAS